MGFLGRRYERKVAASLEKLRAETKAAADAGVTAGSAAAQSLADLPPCVRTYLEKAAISAPNCKVVTAKAKGEFKFDPKGRWQPMETTQVDSCLVPAVFWSCSAQYQPLVSIRGFDGRVGGEGEVDWRLWGWLTANQVAGGDVLNKSMLVRWLSDTPGLPRAMLPSAWVKWEAVAGAHNEAKATVTHGGVTASGIFTFDEAGLVSSFRSNDYVYPKDKMSSGKSWVIRYKGHTMFPLSGPSGAGRTGESMFIPSEAEGVWEDPVDNTEFSYVRFSLQSVSAE